MTRAPNRPALMFSRITLASSWIGHRCLRFRAQSGTRLRVAGTARTLCHFTHRCIWCGVDRSNGVCTQGSHIAAGGGGNRDSVGVFELSAQTVIVTTGGVGGSHDLDTEAGRLERHIDAITAAAGPFTALAQDCAATLLAAIGDNTHRVRTMPSSPNSAASRPSKPPAAKTIRHRLNRGGNRDANRALHTILVVRMRRHQPTRDYLARRPADSKPKNEAMHCLKRYIARDIFHTLQEAPETGPRT
jgi:hypothetical protein